MVMRILKRIIPLAVCFCFLVSCGGGRNVPVEQLVLFKENTVFLMDGSMKLLNGDFTFSDVEFNEKVNMLCVSGEVLYLFTDDETYYTDDLEAFGKTGLKNIACASAYNGGIIAFSGKRVYKADKDRVTEEEIGFEVKAVCTNGAGVVAVTEDNQIIYSDDSEKYEVVYKNGEGAEFDYITYQNDAFYVSGTRDGKPVLVFSVNGKLFAERPLTNNRNISEEDMEGFRIKQIIWYDNTLKAFGSNGKILQMNSCDECNLLFESGFTDISAAVLDENILLFANSNGDMKVYDELVENGNKITPQEVDGLLLEGAVLIDVRTKEEYEKGHMEKSVNIPADEIPGEITRQIPKSTPVILYCSSGIRSARAADALIKAGYTVYDLGGVQNY